jgi:hypothetical protein
MEVVRYVLPHFISGCVGGVIVAIGMVVTNIGSLGDLVLHVDGGWLGFALLTLGCALTFGSIAIGSAIMSIGRAED